MPSNFNVVKCNLTQLTTRSKCYTPGHCVLALWCVVPLQCILAMCCVLALHCTLKVVLAISCSPKGLQSYFTLICGVWVSVATVAKVGPLASQRSAHYMCSSAVVLLCGQQSIYFLVGVRLCSPSLPPSPPFLYLEQFGGCYSLACLLILFASCFLSFLFSMVIIIIIIIIATVILLESILIGFH